MSCRSKASLAAHRRVRRSSRAWVRVASGLVGLASVGLGAGAVGCSDFVSCEELKTCSGAAGAAGAAAAEPETAPKRVPACDPETDSCSSLDVVYLSPLGDDDGDGSKDSPVTSLSEALRLAQLKDRHVFACSDGGAYQEPLALAEEHSGLTIFGGFACKDFGRNGRPTEFLTDGHGHRVVEADEVTLGDLRLVADDAEEPGASSTSLLIVSSQNVKLLRSQLVAGQGAAGENGAAPQLAAEKGADGSDGRDGCSDKLASESGQSVVTVCDGQPTTSVGGKGGLAGASSATGQNGGQPGGGGLPALGGGQGGQGDQGSGCTEGSPGTSGADGSAGEAAPTLGTLVASGYRPSRGAAGEAGGVGQGGGGGGGALYPNNCGGVPPIAGGGGGGGCGGQGGEGGQSGGGSFGLLSFESSVELVDVTIRVARGGSGGEGADFQAGGAGGEPGAGGGSWDDPAATAACAGGRGGAGGAGGPGGGGAGGPSLAIGYVGQAPGQEKVAMELPETGAPGGVAGDKGDGTAATESDGPEGIVAKALEI